MNFNLNLQSNYNTSQYALNKLLNQNSLSNQNLAPRFLALNGSNSQNSQSNANLNSNSNNSANNLIALGLAQSQSNHNGTNSYALHRNNSYGLSSTANSSNSSSTSSSLSSSLTNLNFTNSASNLNSVINNNANSTQSQTNQNQLNHIQLNNANSNGQLSSSSASLIASVVAAAAAAENNNYNNLLTNSSLSHLQTPTCNLNNTLFVGNLHASLQEIDLIQVFRPFGHIVECCKKWLHFGFVKFTTEEEACHAYVTLNGFRLKGRPMRLEFQNRTKKARIKAILAQAALQSVATPGGFRNDNNNIEAPLASLNYSSYFNETNQHHQSQHHHNHHHQQQQQHNQFNQQQQQIANNLSSFMQSVGINGNANTNNIQQSSSSNCLFSNATTNSMIESLYKSVESNSNLGCSLPYENSFFNPEQLIKFATGMETEKENSGNKPSEYDFFGSISKNNLYDVNNPEKEKQIINNLNSIINDSKENDIKRTQLSPAISPQHDISSSLSSDSGCRSTSFLNDEDSGMSSLTTGKSNQVIGLLNGNESGLLLKKSDTNILSKLDDCTLSEHLEFTTCSNSSPVKKEKPSKMKQLIKTKISENDEDDFKLEGNILRGNTNGSEIHIKINDFDLNNYNEDELKSSNGNNNINTHTNNEEDNEDESDTESDTSDDASEMPCDADCLNDLENIDEQFLINGCHSDSGASSSNEFSGSDLQQQAAQQIKYNQVIENDGTMVRKKLDCGIYQSINQTLSLFIEPNDILKPMNEFNEFSLFPNAIDNSSNVFTLNNYFQF